MIKPVKILPYQVDHFKRVVQILRTEYGYMDVSPFGAGKTHIAFAIAATYQMSMIIVCPKTAINTWKMWSKIYGVNLIKIITYQSLRGMKGSYLNHDLLTKREGDSVEYLPTEKFTQHVMNKLLLVFDEVHNVKNDNSQLASAHSLVKELVRLVRMGYKSRIALLSATPSDQKENVTSVLKMLGIILSNKLYNYNRSSKKYEPLGIQEAVNKAKNYDKDETFHITCRPLNKTTAKTICHDLYTKVLKKYMTSSMPPPPIDSEKDCKNFYVIMGPDDLERLKKGVMMFSAATDYKEETQEINVSSSQWGQVTFSRREIDSAKIPTTCRLADENLISNPHCKIVIFCNYTRDILEAARLLAKYNPLIMYGDTSVEDREKAITNFQDDNDNYRVMISNVKVGGAAIGLDDKVGTRPRIMYILPSYFFTDQYQATGRIYRNGTKSKATIRFIYSREFPYETGILNSFALKSIVAKSMLMDRQNDILFPGEYEELIEYTKQELIEINKKV